MLELFCKYHCNEKKTKLQFFLKILAHTYYIRMSRKCMHTQQSLLTDTRWEWGSLKCLHLLTDGCEGEGRTQGPIEYINGIYIVILNTSCQPILGAHILSRNHINFKGVLSTLLRCVCVCVCVYVCVRVCMCVFIQMLTLADTATDIDFQI